MAQINICLWGRATGKTEGPMATFSIDNIHKMPRSNGFLLGTTYEQLLTRTLPPLIAAWENLGFKQNKHFWIGKYAPEKFKLQKAYRHPISPDHYIHFYNGSGIYMVSQDRPGTINGVRTQWGAGDEAKLLDYQKVRDEALLTMAGQAEQFAHLSNYLSLLFCSDMPDTQKGQWLLDYKKQMDEATITAILQCQIEVMKLQEQMAKASDLTKLRLTKRIKQFESDINELRKDTVYCSYASTLDNIHALGMGPIKQFKRTLNDLTFKLSVLNQQILQVENGFYAGLDEDKHGYNAYAYDYIDSLGTESVLNGAQKNSRWDADVNPEAPLDISCDYNNILNSMVIGQAHGPQYRILKNMYVERPKLLKHLAQDFCDYYRHHRCKHVNYYYDHTAIPRSASSDVSFADEWYSILEQNGWTVSRCYIGQASSHRSRYLLWEMLLNGDPRLSKFYFNRSNCKELQYSMQQAKVKQKAGTFTKNKDSETDGKTPPIESTHLSEAADCLIWGTQRSKVEGYSAFIDTVAT